jgi:hypothetical protein
LLLRGFCLKPMNLKDHAIDSSEITGDTLSLKFVPLSALSKLDEVLLQKNFKRHDIGGLWQSIERYGFVNPAKFDVNLNGGKGGLVFGNGRTEAIVGMLIEAQRDKKDPPRGVATNADGEWCVPVLFGVDQASEALARSLAIDDNNFVMAGGDFTAWDMAKMWDVPEYVGLLKGLAEEETLAITVDEDGLASLLLGLAGDGDRPEETEEDLEELEEAIGDDDYVGRVKPGEIWRLGRHFVACGDCCKEANIEELKRAAGVNSVEMVWADPPYGISIVATNGYVGGGEANNIPFGGVKNETPEQREKRMGYVGGGNCRRTTIAENAAKKQGLGSVGGSKPFGSADVRGSDGTSNVVKVNKYYPIAGDDSIDTAINSTDSYLRLFGTAVHCWWGGNYFAHVLPPSNCWIVWDKENTGNFADAELGWTNQPSAVRVFKHMWNGMVKASEHGQRRVHPTQKPVALASWFFEKYGKAGDTIIDPFLGSGMSLIAAEQLGDRTVIGFELSEKYCSIILDRWEKLTGGTAEKVGELP